VCCVWSKVWTVWSRSGEHGRLGSLKTVSVLCVFGPSLFGYNWFIGVHITQVFNQYVYGFPKLVNLQFALCFWDCDFFFGTFVLWDCNSCLQFVCDFLIPWCLIAIVCSFNLYYLWCGIFWLLTSTILLAFDLE
jgi:hypothetical protein